jgi:hypothetical protein
MEIIKAIAFEFGIKYTIYSVLCLDGRRLLAVSDEYIVWNE